MATLHDIGVAAQIGSYSDGVETPQGARWLYTSGTPGLAADGTLPADIAGQAEIAWTHIVTLLERAGMTVHHLVKVTQYLLHAGDIPAYAAVRKRFKELSLERSLQLRSDLRSEGIDTVQLRTDAPYIPPLQRFFKSRGRARI